MEKSRSKDVVSGETVVGNVAGKIVILFDDLINTGTTIARAAAACRALGASQVYAVVTHGAFMSKANAALHENALTKIVITNTVYSTGLDETLRAEKIITLDVSALFAEAILRLHTGGSLASLMDMNDAK